MNILIGEDQDNKIRSVVVGLKSDEIERLLKDPTVVLRSGPVFACALDGMELFLKHTPANKILTGYGRLDVNISTSVLSDINSGRKSQKMSFRRAGWQYEVDIRKQKRA